MIEEAAEPPISKKPTRVAQLSAKIKSVASVSEKSKSVSKQKRPAPDLPAEAKRVGERLQELNGYVASKARGEVRFLMRQLPTCWQLERATGVYRPFLTSVCSAMQPVNYMDLVRSLGEDLRHGTRRNAPVTAAVVVGARHSQAGAL